MAPSNAKPLTGPEMGLNFGLVGVSCVAAQSTVHWSQTTMVRQQLAAMSEDGAVKNLGMSVDMLIQIELANQRKAMVYSVSKAALISSIWRRLSGEPK